MGTVFWSGYKRLVSRLTYIGILLGSISLFVMMLMVSIYIVVRKTIGAGRFDATELSGYLMTVTIFFSLAYTFREGGFIKVELLYEKYPPRVRNVVDIVLNVLGLCYCYLLARYSISQVMMSYKSGIHSNSTYRVLLYYPQALVAIGSVLLLMVMLEIFGDSVIRLFTGSGIQARHIGSELLDKGGED